MSWKKQEITTAALSSVGHVMHHDHTHRLAFTTVLCRLRCDGWEGTRDFPQTPQVWRMLAISVSQSWAFRYSFLQFCPRTHSRWRLASWRLSSLISLSKKCLSHYAKERCASQPCDIIARCAALEHRTRRHGTSNHGAMNRLIRLAKT